MYYYWMVSCEVSTLCGSDIQNGHHPRKKFFNIGTLMAKINIFTLQTWLNPICTWIIIEWSFTKLLNFFFIDWNQVRSASPLSYKLGSPYFVHTDILLIEDTCSYLYISHFQLFATLVEKNSHAWFIGEI